MFDLCISCQLIDNLISGAFRVGESQFQGLSSNWHEWPRHRVHGIISRLRRGIVSYIYQRNTNQVSNLNSLNFENCTKTKVDFLWIYRRSNSHNHPPLKRSRN